MAAPVDLKRLTNVNFHCSPAASRNDDGSFNVGAVTATASFRFSKWLPRWFEVSGAKVIVGKGGMSEQDYRDVFVPAGAVRSEANTSELQSLMRNLYACFSLKKKN